MKFRISVSQIHVVWEQSTTRVNVLGRNPHNNWTNHDILELCCEKNKREKECKKYSNNNSLKQGNRRLRNKSMAKTILAKKMHYVIKFTESPGELSKNMVVSKWVNWQIEQPVHTLHFKKEFRAVWSHISNEWNHFCNQLKHCHKKAQHSLH